ncbi:MAG TPA: peroxidase family protein [Bryobacteraceae bacterium]|nr:peroxidase family protein [Bryobacteraceae bacterium]
MKIVRFSFFLLLASLAPAQNSAPKSPPSGKQEESAALKACAQAVLEGFRKIAPDRNVRFEAKVSEANLLCRGGERALQFHNTPWVDWSNYWGTGDNSSLPKGFLVTQGPTLRGVSGALLDLEYQRVELIKFNLFDDSGTYEQFVKGREGIGGPALKVWPEMRLKPDHPNYKDVGGDDSQICRGDLIRWRTQSGICNDILNPAMGSSGQLFARNVEFETTFPESNQDQLTRNRHGDRLALLQPDPQVISRRLLSRIQSNPDACRDGYGLPDYSPAANCDYKKAPFFNVLAAYWIQFMTHDWFSHLEEGHNDSGYMKVGCETQLVNNVPTPLSPEQIEKLGCRPDDSIDQSYFADQSAPGTFSKDGRQYLSRAPKTETNTNTAWWDASQLYGYDSVSVQRVKRDPKDLAKLLLEPVSGQTGLGYLPVLAANDPMNPEWAGQEAAAFPDNWTIGLSFLHNLFAREHNSFVTEFRRIEAATPEADSGLRNPANPKQVIRYKDVTAEELFQVARLVVAAEIAKIHTTEWTPQLLYDEPLYKGMNANWNGLLGSGEPLVSKALNNIVVNDFGKSKDVEKSSQWYSVFASGPGIFGLGSKVRGYDITNPKYTNGGVNHFGSPFNFPEEFVSVYRLHPLVPDLLEYRELNKDPNKIVNKIPVIDTFEGKATGFMRSRGLANWALTLGRQRLGLLELHNDPVFLQNLKLPRLNTKTGQIDVVALDLIRDREHGVPRFNEFRRQYGLRQLTSFDDFVDQSLAANDPNRLEQEETVKTMREVYGQHVCDASKVITDAQLNEDKSPINDCLGHPDGTLIDNIEDVDTVVGYLAEPTRPHGFAISETQFVVFILNASRRLFSDRFFTSCFRPEFYTKLGVEWVTNNGPGPAQIEKGMPNGHKQPVSPLKRVLLRNIPELNAELSNVVNAFDPWARDRGEYYTLDWKPRPGAESDDAFHQ